MRVAKTKTLRRLRPLAAGVLFAFAASCQEDTISLGLPNQPCVNLFVVEGFDRPINAQLGAEIVPVGSSRHLRVRVLQGREIGGADLYDHCPRLSLDRVGWAIVDSSVARLETRGAEATLTGLTVGETSFWVGFGVYRREPSPLGGERLQKQIRLRVVESQSAAAASRKVNPPGR